jgi:signal transduction histidine kinase
MTSDYFDVGPKLALVFVVLIAVILGGNGLVIWQFEISRIQTDRLTGANRQLIAVLQLQANLLSFHQQLEDLARSGDARRLTAEAAPLRQILRDQAQRTRSAVASLPREIQVDPAFLPILDAIEVALPAQLDAIQELAKSGDWGTVQRRLGNELKPIESQTSVLVENIDQEAQSELAQAAEKMSSVQRSILMIVPATAISTVMIAAVFGWAIARRILELRLEARVNERTRLARVLHDTLLQSFQGLMLRLQVVSDLLPQGKAKEELEQTLQRADQAIAEGRDAVYDLRSSATTTNDLAQALRALGNELATPDGRTFRLVVEGSTRDLHPIVRDEVYRISREALRNAFTHSQGHHIEAEITYGDRLFRLRIRDDGEGIAPAILEQGRAGHYGLPGMRERAKQIGANLSIWSGTGAGTEVELNIPGSIAYEVVLGARFRIFRKRTEQDHEHRS